MSDFTEQLLEKIAELHKRAPFRKTFPIRGCNPEDIDKVMQAQKVTFIPPIYRDFLLTVGYGSGGLFEGEDFTINRLQVLKEILQDNLEDMNMWDETFEDVFVFMDHHSYVHYFFHTSEQNPDPTVYIIVSEYDAKGVASCGFPLSDYLLKNKQCG